MSLFVLGQLFHIGRDTRRGIISKKMKKEDLEVDHIYHLKKGTEGLKICVIQSNRNNMSKNKTMMEACKDIGMQQPAIFAEAHLPFEAGYTLLDVVDGHEVTKDEINQYLVILDGNTRWHAYQLSWDGAEEGGFEYIFHIRNYTSAAASRKAYQKMNVYNNATKAEDFARDLMATSKSTVLQSYSFKTGMGLYPKASGFATIGREITKKDMTMIQDGKTPQLFDDQENLKRFNRVFDSMKELVEGNPNVFRGSEVWKFNATKINEAEDKDKMVEKILRLYSKMNALVLTALQKAKSNRTESKEVVVHKILEEAFKSLD